tara:strand:- start:69705 stop:69911 length:207 start_codon:yes stop_codon:yes gene_type:complete
MISLNDVRFSNPTIKDTYRILKRKYYQDRTILSSNKNEEAGFFVNDYNNIRINYKQKIHTPNEIFRTP